MESKDIIAKYIFYIIIIIIIIYNIYNRGKYILYSLCIIFIMAIFNYISKKDNKTSPTLTPENTKTLDYKFIGKCVYKSEYDNTRRRLLNKIVSKSDYYLDKIDSVHTCNKLIPNNRKYIAYKKNRCIGFEKEPILTTTFYCQPDTCNKQMIRDDKGNTVEKTICTSPKDLYNNIPLYKRQ